MICPSCNGDGCEDCLGLGFIPPVSQDQMNRIQELFYKKLAEQHPDHPWVKRREALNNERQPTTGKQVGIKLECIHEHIGAAWYALKKEGREIGEGDDRPKFPIGSVEYHLNAIEKYAGELFQLLAKISPEVGNT